MKPRPRKETDKDKDKEAKHMRLAKEDVKKDTAILRHVQGIHDEVRALHRKLGMRRRPRKTTDTKR